MLNVVNIGAQCGLGGVVIEGWGMSLPPGPQVIKFTHAQLLALFCPRAQPSCLRACL